MKIKLTKELVRLVDGKVATGLYRNRSEVVREALRLLAGQDRLREAAPGRARNARRRAPAASRKARSSAKKKQR